MSKYTLGHVDDRGLCRVLCDGAETWAFAAPHIVFSDDCVITGGEFRGGMFHDGVFRNGYLPLQINGSRHFLNIPDGVHIRIGCEEHTPEEWLLKGAKIAANTGYTEAQVAEYMEYIHIAKAQIERAKQS